MGIRFVCYALATALWLATAAEADDAQSVSALEKQAVADLAAGHYGPADEKIRAAIALADNDTFIRLALLQGFVAMRMGSDGRSLMGAAMAAHQSNAWPRPIIGYLLGEQKLQQVADGVQRAGLSHDEKRQRICELSFYAGAFAASDGEKRFAGKLLEKAAGICETGSAFATLTTAEEAALKAQP
ncbi:MAG: hypothetical protein HYU58_11180 [Proteobacteria bacterium]|nr:hypothetical protein [Pseudomonadota bacterium]